MSTAKAFPRLGLLVLVAALGSSWLLWPHMEYAETRPGRFPNEFEWVKRTWPYFNADPAAIRTAADNAHKMRRAAKSRAFGIWESVGPTNIPGRVSDVAFDPLHPGTLWASAATGGVLKSNDAGTSWTFVFDDAPTLSIGDLAIDPSNPSIVYVGTGEANGGHNNKPGAGLFKSTDGGSTWRLSGLEESTSIGRVLIDYSNPTRVWVAAIGSYFAPDPNRGVYRSLNGGSSWDQVLFLNDSTGVVDLAIHPSDPDILYAAAWQRVRRVTGTQLSGIGSGVYKTEDGGETWTRLTEGLDVDSGVGRVGIAICPANPDILYALYNNDITHRGLFRSDNAGATWQELDPSGELKLSVDAVPFTWYFGQVRVDPEDCDRVFVLDVPIATSEDGGISWTFQSGTHVDHHAMAFNPHDPNIVLDGNDGGIAISDSRGELWTRVLNMPTTQFYEIGLDPSNPERFFGGTQDNGTLRRDGNDRWVRILGGDGFYVIVDPENPNIVYAESQWGRLVKVVNGSPIFALSGINRNEKTNWSTPVVMDPNNNQVLYYGAERLYRTVDAAVSWGPISPNLARGGSQLLGTISTIAVSPVDSNIVWVGTDDGYVWVTNDYGNTWARVSDGLPLRWVTRVIADPLERDVAYITYSGLRWRDPETYVYRTRDLGVTWSDITSNLPEAPVNAFAVDPVDTDVLYLGSDVGAFVSLNGGLDWQVLGTGIPIVPVYDMKVYQNDSLHFLVAGTHGRSMYRLDLKETVTNVAQEPMLPDAFTLEAAYPNPFTHSLQLEYQLRHPARVEIDVVDVLGRHVSTVEDVRRNAGSYAATWMPHNIAPGRYFVRLNADGVVRQVLAVTHI